MTVSRVALSVVLSAASWCVVASAPLPLTVDEAVSSALDRNREVTARAARLAAAEADAEAAGKPPPVTLSLSPATIWGNLEAAVSLVLDISGRRKWASRAARHEAAAMLAGNQEFALELAAAARSSYWHLWVAQERVGLASEQLRLAQEAHKGADRLADAGIGVGIDAERAAAVAAGADHESAGARAALRRAQTQLACLLYLPPATDTVAAEGPPDAPRAWPPTDILQELGLARRPAMREVGALARAALARAGIAAAESTTDLGLSLERGDGVNFGRALLQQPLIDFGTIKHGKRAARARAKAAVADVDVMEAEIRQEVQVAADDLAAAIAAEARLRDEFVPRQRYLLARVERAYRARSVTYLDVLEARTSLQSLLHALLDAVIDRLDAQVRLDRATGAPLEGNRDAETDD